MKTSEILERLDKLARRASREKDLDNCVALLGAIQTIKDARAILAPLARAWDEDDVSREDVITSDETLAASEWMEGMGKS